MQGGTGRDCPFAPAFFGPGRQKASFAGVEYDVTEFDAELLASGELAPADLEIDPGAMALRLMGGIVD